ncbi:hypothetical protein [Taibaiella soli]|nr:hypothetical protein [Taibaiella soli]
MATLISKEEIPTYKLVPAFIDKTQTWLRELGYAVRLGNSFKGKTAITFETTNGPRTVETTVWYVDERFMQLKGGTVIPLQSVIDMHF